MIVFCSILCALHLVSIFKTKGRTAGSTQMVKNGALSLSKTLRQLGLLELPANLTPMGLRHCKIIKFNTKKKKNKMDMLLYKTAILHGHLKSSNVQLVLKFHLITIKYVNLLQHYFRSSRRVVRREVLKLLNILFHVKQLFLQFTAKLRQDVFNMVCQLLEQHEQ